MINLPRLWYQSHGLMILLLPFSWLFRSLVFLRRVLYRLGLKKSTRFPVPIIVVGNITVGGTGKTPLVAYLAKLLQSQEYRPGIVSRGYTGESDYWPRLVTAESDPTVVGDEAVMLQQQTGCPMVVGPDRVAAVKKLLSETDCNIVISDDGLQHYAMDRDIEIAVVDGIRQFGNRYCLPAGPLREPLSRLQHVDFVVTNGATIENNFTMHLQPGEIYNVANPSLHLSLEDCQDRAWHAVAGIGHPERFFFQLEHLGFRIHGHHYPDHFRFSLKDIDFGDNTWVIMTEKDAVKCRSFANERHWCLPVQAELDSDFSTALLKRLGRSKNNHPSESL